MLEDYKMIFASFYETKNFKLHSYANLSPTKPSCKILVCNVHFTILSIFTEILNEQFKSTGVTFFHQKGKIDNKILQRFFFKSTLNGHNLSKKFSHERSFLK